MLDAVKLAIPVKTDYYDNALTALINSALADLALVGIDVTNPDALVTRAVITYCRAMFNNPDNYDQLIKAYHDMKTQMITGTGYGLL